VLEHHLVERGARQAVRLKLDVDGQIVDLEGEGNGPLDAALAATALPMALHSYEERAIGSGASARAAATIELTAAGVTGSRFGVAIHPNIVTASILAMFCGINRVLAAMDATARQESLRQLRHLGQRRELRGPRLRSA
jgi:2-isopropylmalate synthase